MTVKEAQSLITKLNKKFGAGTIVVASDVRHDLIPRFTSGSLALDVILGGGWPGNQWVEIVGEESHGKTCLVLKTIAANQARDPDFTVAWVAAEPINLDYWHMCGVDSSRVILIETNVMEDAYAAVIEFCESRSVDCIVIDSLPALVPTTEDEKQVGEFSPGRGAFLTNQFFRKVGKATKRSLTDGNDRPIMCFLINQWREKIGVIHGDPRTTGGGKGKNYATFVRCDVRRDEWREIGPSGNKRRIGQTIRILTLKNKTAPAQQKAYVDFYFAPGGPVEPGAFDYAKEVVAMGVMHGVIERKGGWFYYGDSKWQGAPALLAELRGNRELADVMDRDVLDALAAGSQAIASDDADED